MSPKAENERGLGRLLAHAGAGIEIRVLDGDGREVKRGNDSLSIALPEGVYAVEWHSAGMCSENLVRVPASSQPAEIRYVPEENASSAGSKQEFLPQSEIVSRVGAGPRTSERNYGSSVAVVVSAQEGVSPVEAIGPTRLLDRAGQAMRANKAGELELELSSRESARVYHVDPGLYRLSFRSITGEMLHLTVPAMRHRQTVVFLQAIHSDVLIAKGNGFVREPRMGIEAARTIIVSVNGEEDDHRIRERIRLTGVLLHDIAHGVGSLSKSFAAILDDSATDPLLQLYGALVVLSRLEDGGSPALDEPWPSEAGALSAFRKRWANCATRWIGTPGTAGSPPDRVAAWWRLSSLLPGSHDPQQPIRIPKQISAPPMLECTWRWAIAHSVEVQGAIPATPVMVAAARSPTGAAPWLCWKMSAATAAPTKLLQSQTLEWDPLITSLANKASELIKQDPTKLFDILSPDVGVTALRLAQFAADPAKKTSTSSMATDLALALSLPAGALIRRLLRADDEVSMALAEAAESSEKSPHGHARKMQEHGSREAPGLSQRIQVPDDPHKGRFGGKERSNGFIAYASFGSSSSSKWTRISIVVEGQAVDGTPVHFHLHDSFIPDKRIGHFQHGKTQLDVTAWGAFTVGIWLPEQSVELELDLALLAEAPKDFSAR